MSVSKDDVFRTVIAVVLSLLAYIGHGIKSEQIDMACKLRSLEINQARIMERMGIDPISRMQRESLDISLPAGRFDAR